MLFLLEENRHMKLMTRAFNKKTDLSQKNDVTFILKTPFFAEIVNMIGYCIRKLSILLRPNSLTIPYIVFADIIRKSMSFLK